MLVSDIEIVLKNKKKRSVNMFMNNIKIFQRMNTEKYFLECNEQRLAEYKIFLLNLPLVGPWSKKLFQSRKKLISIKKLFRVKFFEKNKNFSGSVFSLFFRFRAGSYARLLHFLLLSLQLLVAHDNLLRFISVLSSSFCLNVACCRSLQLIVTCYGSFCLFVATCD